MPFSLPQHPPWLRHPLSVPRECANLHGSDLALPRRTATQKISSRTNSWSALSREGAHASWPRAGPQLPHAAFPSATPHCSSAAAKPPEPHCRRCSTSIAMPRSVLAIIHAMAAALAWPGHSWPRPAGPLLPAPTAETVATPCHLLTRLAAPPPWGFTSVLLVAAAVALADHQRSLLVRLGLPLAMPPTSTGAAGTLAALCTASIVVGHPPCQIGCR